MMLEARRDRLEEALSRLAEAQARTEAALAHLVEAQRPTREAISELTDGASSGGRLGCWSARGNDGMRK